MDQQLPQAQGRAAGHQPEFLRAALSHPDGGEAHQILSRQSVVDGLSESSIHLPSESPIHSGSEIHSQLTALEIA